MTEDLPPTPPVQRSPTEREVEERLQRLPPEMGAMLLTIGIFGMILPGMVGTPALLAGGLLLWPRGFRGVDRWLRRRCPRLHGQGIVQLLRYLDDMERRYPSTRHSNLAPPSEASP